MPEEEAPPIPLIRRRLLAWFDKHQRDLPWRRDRDPYRIWISEVMLQQTTVATVVPRFEAFVRRFPDIYTLAAADERDVLHAWQGLGYYRRARDLHKTAREIVSRFDGQFPQDPEICRKLPGLGRYLVGALLSQAFEKRLPILEANSERVLARLVGEKGDVRTSPARHRLWSIAERWLPRRRIGDWNQALMELGALVCLPRQPHCHECPLADQCTAFRHGLQDLIPVRARKRPIARRRELCLVISRGDKVLWLRRSPNGRWPHLWEFPRGAPLPDETLEKAACRIADDLAGVRIHLRQHLGTVRYSVLRERVTVECWHADWRGGRVDCRHHSEHRWVPGSEWGALAVSSPQRRLMELVNGSRRQSDDTSR